MSSSLAALEVLEVVDKLDEAVEVQLCCGIRQPELDAQLFNLFVIIISAFFNLIRNVLGVEDAEEDKDIMIGETTVKACHELLEIALC